MKEIKLQKLDQHKVDPRLVTFQFTKLVIKWLFLISFNAEKKHPVPVQMYLELCAKCDKILQGRGIKECIRYVKATRNNFYNYLSKNPLRDPGSPCFGESQFPKILGPFKKYIDDDNHDVIRMILTIITATRSIKLKGDVNLETITQPSRDVPDLTKHMLTF